MLKINSHKAVIRAEELFISGWNCAESVFTALYEQIYDDTVPVQLVTGLGGGMGSRKTCGALTGAIVVLGLGYGRTQPDSLTKTIAYEKSHERITKFRESFYSTECWELTDCEWSESARKANCIQFVTKASERAVELLSLTQKE